MIVTHAQLLEIEGLKRASDLQKALDSKGISYSIGKGGRLWTTTEELDRHVQVQSSQVRRRQFA